MLGNSLGAGHRDKVKKKLKESGRQSKKNFKVWGTKIFEACREGRTYYTSNCRTEFRLCGTGVSQVVGTQLILLLLGTRVCVCVCGGGGGGGAAGHWNWGSAKENNWVSGWRRRHRTREMAELCVHPVGGRPTGWVQLDLLTACPPAQLVPSVQPPLWWSPYSSVGHELRWNTKFEMEGWSFFSLFFLFFFFLVFF
jgi:hypothetical protein